MSLAEIEKVKRKILILYKGAGASLGKETHPMPT